MKNTIKIIGIIVLATIIVFPMAAFGSRDRADTTAAAAPAVEQGTLTITGLDEFNGHYARAELVDDDKRVYAVAEEPIHTGSVGALIADGKVTLPLWEITGTKEEVFYFEDEFGEMVPGEAVMVNIVERYSGNHDAEFLVIIWGDSEFYHWQSYLAGGRMTVTLNNGSAQGVFVKSED
jgi:predicted RecA/RadA family phage recombinase